jgi:hypothetical protein
MGRKYTPEQEIVNLRLKGEITKKEASRRIRALTRREKAETVVEKVVEEVKTNRGVFRRVLDFFTKK